MLKIHSWKGWTPQLCKLPWDEQRFPALAAFQLNIQSDYAVYGDVLARAPELESRSVMIEEEATSVMAQLIDARAIQGLRQFALCYEMSEIDAATMELCLRQSMDQLASIEFSRLEALSRLGIQVTRRSK